MMSTVVQLKRKAEMPVLRCTGCGLTAEAPCDCGAGFEILRPGQAAAKAIAAHPEKSDRAIAVTVGVDHKTVAKARQSSGENSPPQKRTGLDGKQHPVKRKPPRKGSRLWAQAEERKWKAAKKSGAFTGSYGEWLDRLREPPTPAPAPDQSSKELKAHYAEQYAKTGQENLKNIFLMNCAASVGIARNDYRGPMSETLVAEAERVARAWSELAERLRNCLIENGAPIQPDPEAYLR
jgi:hypothetical protein